MERASSNSKILPDDAQQTPLPNEAANNEAPKDDQRWYVTTSQGKLTTDILILGNGPLSEPSLPFEFRRRTRYFDPQHYILTPKEGSTRVGKSTVQRRTSVNPS